MSEISRNPKAGRTRKKKDRRDGKGKPDRGSGCLRGCFWVALIVLFAGLGAGFGVLSAFLKGLPPLTSLDKYRPQLVNKFYDRDGNLKAEIFQEKRELVSLQDIPQDLVDALLAIEDTRFYEHPGVDVIRIVGALIADIRLRRLAQGGSTITQQLAQNLFLEKRKTFERKIKEALLALRIEKHYTKNEILEIYLNQVYFGHATFGVKAAAEFYFHKDLQDLTLSESALLVGLLKAPAHYSPLTKPEAARARRNLILRRMVDVGFVVRERYEDAISEPIQPRQGKRLRVRQKMEHPYFLEYVRRVLIGLEFSYGMSEPVIDSVEFKLGGLRVETTMDSILQASAEEAVKWGIMNVEQHRRKYRYGWGDPNMPYEGGRSLRIGELYDARIVSAKDGQVVFEIPAVSSRQYEMQLSLDETWLDDFDVLAPGYYFRVKATEKVRGNWVFKQEWEPHIQAALVAMKADTGEILAQVGGFDFFERDERQQGQFIRAIQAARQPGSGFKPVVYATALQQGYTPSTILSDARITYTFGRQSWSPKNYHDQYYDEIPLRMALEESQNCATVRLLAALGVGTVQETARRMGFSALHNDLSLALGTSDTKPIEMAVAYGCFANGGRRVRPYFIRKVIDRSGAVLFEDRPSLYPALRPEIAFQMAHILKGVIQYGTGWRAKEMEYPVAGKTGTTNSCMEAWFTGFSPNLVVAVYVGFDQKRPLGHQMTGSFCALPIWKRFMEQAIPELLKRTYGEAASGPDEVKFKEPPGMVWADVCRLSGALANEFCPVVVHTPYLEGTEPQAICILHPEEGGGTEMTPGDFQGFGAEQQDGL